VNPKLTRTLLAILAAAVAAIVAFNVLTREYGDAARRQIERETVTSPDPWRVPLCRPDRGRRR
jgi:hypothetical protein